MASLPLVSSTNQITGPVTVTVAVAGALVAVPGQPLSATVYVKVQLPVTPAGGSKSTVPVDALVMVTVPPAGEVTPTPATVKVGEQPLMPVSASVTPARKPPRLIFMLVSAVKLFGCATGASFTGVTVIVKVCAALVSAPPLAVPPLSWIWTVTVAVPLALAAGVYVSLPVGVDRRLRGNSPLLSLLGR